MSDLEQKVSVDPRELATEASKSSLLLRRSLAEWSELFAEWGERPFRAKQLFRWIHHNGVLDPREMSNLSKSLRERLEQAGLQSPFTVDEVHRSADGTRKLLLALDDGQRIECVLIPMKRGTLDSDQDEEGSAETAREGDTPGRVTLCVSTQVGCAMGCGFCASGQEGLRRGLKAGEVLAQVLIAKRYLEGDEILRNVVFMGMGEPLHHYPETRRALELLTDVEGMNMSPRKITVSTVGLVPGIRKLGRDFGGKIGLAVSLHAPDNATRDKIMPMNRSYNVEELLKALHEYPLPNRRRITIEYTLIDGVNASLEHARGLVAQLRGLRVKVNLIPMNPIAGSPFKAPSDATVDAFSDELTRCRVSCTVRGRKGDDVDAACGQLALRAPKGQTLVTLRRSEQP